jgi:hypothetical protein
MFKEIEKPKIFTTESGILINIERTLMCENCELVFEIDGNDKVLGIYSS